jgi:ABC-type transport system involved in cytochrome bd biosynthesis fused ATPase/permease subunit
MYDFEGCGKSSFLLSLLKEVPYQKGDLQVKGKIAYVEQEPYVFKGTIRANILFGKEYDEETYCEVLKCSCFEDDLK